MPALIPYRFLVRIAHPCWYVEHAPNTDDDAEHLVDLPPEAALANFAALDDRASFADVRVAWNEFGLALQLTVSGKKKPPTGEASRPASADGITLWIDTRDARNSHRASRYCHQFHFLPVAGSGENEEPVVVQAKINRALQDAPLCQSSDIALRCDVNRTGYRLEAFLPVAVLTGFDPEQHPRLGIYYHVRDAELGDQFLGVGNEFPFADDPSLWEVLELVKPERSAKSP